MGTACCTDVVWKHHIFLYLKEYQAKKYKMQEIQTSSVSSFFCTILMLSLEEDALRSSSHMGQAEWIRSYCLRARRWENMRARQASVAQMLCATCSDPCTGINQCFGFPSMGNTWSMAGEGTHRDPSESAELVQCHRAIADLWQQWHPLFASVKGR